MNDTSRSPAPGDDPLGGEAVLDESGHFHATDAPIDLSGYTWEDWLTLGFFWLLALTVFYQFFTRYVLADSAAWTEEIARYLLIVVTFVGSSMAVRRNSHIHVEFLYRWLPPTVGRAMSTLVDIAPSDADKNPASAAIAWRNGVWVATGNLAFRHFGIPTVTVPMGSARDIAMPFGLTFAGAAYADTALLRLATIFEALRPRRTAPPRTPEL